MLYLHVGPPKAPPAKTLETPEGHTVEYDAHCAIIGLELMGVRGMLDRNEELQLTWPAGTSGGQCAAQRPGVLRGQRLHRRRGGCLNSPSLIPVRKLTFPAAVQRGLGGQPLAERQQRGDQGFHLVEAVEALFG